MSEIFFTYFGLGRLIHFWRSGQNPLKILRGSAPSKGMSVVHDWKDVLGGYPFEIALPDVVFDFFKGKGLGLEKLETCGGGLGCNEFGFFKKTEGTLS